MNPAAWLLGLALPACAAVGADRVPVPPPLDAARLARPSSPNTALAAPADNPVRPDIATHVFDIPPAQLFAAVAQVAAHQPRTYPLGPARSGITAQWVARSAVWNFPDVISVQIMPRGTEQSSLALYSQSLYGRSDFGVNRRRVETWLAELDATLTPRK